MNQPLPNILGPGAPPNTGTELELPDCVQIKTDADMKAFKLFLEAVVNAANKNALDEIASYVVSQNAAMTVLVKKLGA